MYESSIGGTVGGGIAVGTLPLTGLSVGWQIVLAATLIVAGIALMRMVPRLGRRRG
jgi:hypothetical protein